MRHRVSTMIFSLSTVGFLGLIMGFAQPPSAIASARTPIVINAGASTINAEAGIGAGRSRIRIEDDIKISFGREISATGISRIGIENRNRISRTIIENRNRISRHDIENRDRISRIGIENREDISRAAIIGARPGIDSIDIGRISRILVSGIDIADIRSDISRIGIENDRSRIDNIRIRDEIQSNHSRKIRRLIDWDSQARQDMQGRMSRDSRSSIAIQNTYGKNENWLPGWELRWWAFKQDEGRTIWVYHVRSKSSGERYTSIIDPKTGRLQNWEPIR